MWKRERIRAAGLIEPPSLIFAPVDFEQESLSEGLTRAGLEPNQPAFFQWLGVVPYLTKDAVSSTLKFISEVPQAVVVFDYAEPFQNYPAERRASVIATAERAASRGEPWLSLFDPVELLELLRGEGFQNCGRFGAPRNSRAALRRPEARYHDRTWSPHCSGVSITRPLHVNFSTSHRLASALLPYSIAYAT